MLNTDFVTPNTSSRHGEPIQMLVLHATAGSLRSSLAWLTNPKSGVSAHYVIDRDGTTYQLAPDAVATWHAGASVWRGLGATAIQRRSIGIELVNRNTGNDPYPELQYRATRDLVRTKLQQHSMVPDMLVRHLDIAIPKGRKSDPAGFPWQRLRHDLSAVVAGRPHLVMVARFDGARVRSAPHTHADILRTYDAGDVVLVYEIIEGEPLETRVGRSSKWAKLVDGYMWLPLLEGE